MYIITARRMISGLVLKYLNGERFVMDRRYETALPGSVKGTGLERGGAVL